MPRVGSGSHASCIANMSARKQKNRVLDFDDLLLYWHVDDAKPGAGAEPCRRISITCWWMSIRTPAPCRAKSSMRSSPTARASPWSATMRRRSTRSAPRRSRTFWDSPTATSRRPRCVVLAQNYRSTQQVLDTANALMADGARQHRKTLLGTRQSDAEAALRVARRCAGSSRIHHRQDLADARDRRFAEAPRHSVPQLSPQRRARGRAHEDATFRS